MWCHCGRSAGGRTVDSRHVSNQIARDAEFNVKQDMHGVVTSSSAQMIEELAEEEHPSKAEATKLKRGCKDGGATHG
eukprot:scaffold34093_cov59-Attheya_sp.AAC.3